MSNIITSATITKNDDGTFKLTAGHPNKAVGTVNVSANGHTISPDHRTIQAKTTSTSWNAKIEPAPQPGARFSFILSNQYDVVF